MAAPTFSPLGSSYLINRVPDRYGGAQSEYRASVDLNILCGVRKLQQKESFPSILDFLGKRRAFLAKKANTEDKEDFGEKRNQGLIYGMVTTPLCGGLYDEYNARFLPLFQQHIGHMLRNHLKNYRLDLEPAFKGTPQEKKASLKFKMFDLSEAITHTKAPELRSLGLVGKGMPVVPTYTREHLRRLFSSLGLPSSDKCEDAMPIIASKKCMEELQKKDPAEYKKWKLAPYFAHIESLCLKEEKTAWVVATLSSEIDGKMYAFAQYLTWINQKAPDPVQYMAGHSFINIIHQDPFIADEMLLKISQLFDQAVLWNKEEGLPSLKDQVATIHYYIQHATPWERGSGAAGEWIEQILYRYHGYKVSYNNDRSPPFEALTSSLGDFVSKYDTMIRLEKVEPPAS